MTDFFTSDNVYMPDSDGVTFPSFAYLGAANQVKDNGGPFFSIEADSVGNPPAGFMQTEWQFGQDPNSPMTTVWAGRNLICTILAERKRAVVTTPSGTKHYYHYLTKRSERIDGRYSLQTQLLLAVEGMGDELVTLGLSGLGRSCGWSNNPNGSYGTKGAPLGVQEQLKAWTKKINQQYRQHLNGAKLPYTYAWKIFLTPLTVTKNGQERPSYLSFGQGDATSYFAPFTMQWLGDKLTDRYVGKETHARYNDLLLSDDIQEWIHAWDQFDNSKAVAVAGAAAPGFDDSDEDDEIPF